MDCAFLRSKNRGNTSLFARTAWDPEGGRARTPSAKRSVMKRAGGEYTVTVLDHTNTAGQHPHSPVACAEAWMQVGAVSEAAPRGRG